MNQKLPIYVLDNSVILKPILQEKDWDKVIKIFFLKDTYKLSIFLPEIFRYEFLSTLIREKNEKDALEAYKNFTAHQVTVLPLEDDLIHRAIKINSKYPKTSFYDAVYHALAIAYNCNFITANEKYFNITKKEGHIKLLKNLKI